TKSTELRNFNLVWAGGLECWIQRLSLYQLLAQLPPALTLLAGLLRRERFLIPVELRLFPDVDLILRCSGKHVILFPIVLHGRTSALGNSIDRLLLLRVSDRYDLKTRLREQGLFLGHFTTPSASRRTCG